MVCSRTTQGEKKGKKYLRRQIGVTHWLALDGYVCTIDFRCSKSVVTALYRISGLRVLMIEVRQTMIRVARAHHGYGHTARADAHKHAAYIDMY